MASARENMKMIDVELERVRADIDRLRLEESVLIKLRAKMGGEPLEAVRPRRRANSVKPLVLDLIHAAAHAGMTSTEVAQRVREQVPDVAKDTVGSVLSRLKSEGAFVYVGERYFEKKYAPKDAAGAVDSLRVAI